MSLDAARLWLAAADARSQQHSAARAAAEGVARELHEDGGLIAYANRLARRRDPARAAKMDHLAPIAERCEAAERAMRGNGPPVFTAMHAAVQHGKTSLLQAFVLRTLRRNPRARIAYVSFNADRAEGKMWECRELAHGEGIHIHPTFNTKREWRTIEGGIVRAGGILDGSWTGGGFDVIIPDDLYAGPHEADSAAHRSKVERSFDDVIMTRIQPWTSVLVNMARWNPYDLSGVLIRRGWRYVCLPAIDAQGRALWPEVKPLAELLALRDGRPASGEEPAIAPIPRRTWAALYQGRPVAEGSHVFDPAHLVTYDRLPEGAYIEAVGVDAAYGAKARNDRSVLVTWRRYAAEPRTLYLVESWIGHEPIELFACRAAALQIRRAGGPQLVLPRAPRDIEAAGGWRAQFARADVARARRILGLWYAAGTEKAAESLLTSYGAAVRVAQAGIDKLARAQGGYVDPLIGGYTSTWSEGRIRWPAQEDQHAQAIRIQHEDFTGSPNDDDDGVDAAVAGHDAVQVQVIGAAMHAQQQARMHALAKARTSSSIDGGSARLRGW